MVTSHHVILNKNLELCFIDCLLLLQQGLPPSTEVTDVTADAHTKKTGKSHSSHKFSKEESTGNDFLIPESRLLTTMVTKPGQIAEEEKAFRITYPKSFATGQIFLIL